VNQEEVFFHNTDLSNYFLGAQQAKQSADQAYA